MEELTSLILVIFGELIVYNIGRIAIFIGTFGRYRAEELSSEDATNVDSYMLDDRVVSEGTTWIVGILLTVALIVTCIVLFFAP